MKRAFVRSLKTPALLALFSKDSTCADYAVSVIQVLATLDPKQMMPDLLERAYSSLEAVNETHRTNAVFKMLTAISYQLVTWPQAQRHVVPLLESALPGIDLVCHSLLQD
jgi:proteasome activator subunit 4